MGKKDQKGIEAFESREHSNPGVQSIMGPKKVAMQMYSSRFEVKGDCPFQFGCLVFLWL